MTTEANQLTVVDIPEDCGNAPRKIVIRDFLIAVYDLQIDDVTESIHDSIQWDVVGSQMLSGPDEVRAWLVEQPRAVELTLNTVITHGTDCGADGAVKLAEGSRSSFSHIIVFAGHGKNAKIKEIRSYIIDA